MNIIIKGFCISQLQKKNTSNMCKCDEPEDTPSALTGIYISGSATQENICAFSSVFQCMCVQNVCVCVCTGSGGHFSPHGIKVIHLYRTLGVCLTLFVQTRRHANRQKDALVRGLNTVQWSPWRQTHTQRHGFFP